MPDTRTLSPSERTTATSRTRRARVAGICQSRCVEPCRGELVAMLPENPRRRGAFLVVPVVESGELMAESDGAAAEPDLVKSDRSVAHRRQIRDRVGCLVAAGRPSTVRAANDTPAAAAGAAAAGRAGSQPAHAADFRYIRDRRVGTDRDLCVGRGRVAAG